MTLEPLFTDFGIPLALMGMLVVFAALTIVSVFIAFLPRIMDSYADWSPDEKAQIEHEKAQRDEISEETAAVIAAAAAYAIGPRHRIVHIQRGVPGDEGWAFEGRRQHHASHFPNKKPKS